MSTDRGVKLGPGAAPGCLLREGKKPCYCCASPGGGGGGGGGTLITNFGLKFRLKKFRDSS